MADRYPVVEQLGSSFYGEVFAATVTFRLAVTKINLLLIFNAR
jgi:hypothetical protein